MEVDDSLSVEHLIRKIPDGQETIFDLLDEGGESVRKIEITRRKLQPELPLSMPEQEIARAKARSHVFNDIVAFSEYLNREASDISSLVLADVNSRTITAVLDEDQEGDREMVTLRAVEHPLFTPWGRMLGEAVSVVDFALFVMQHRRAVVVPDGRELAHTFSQVKMSKAIQMWTGTGKKSLNGVICEVEIAGERKGAPVELPETIAIETPLFVGTSPQRIELDLLVTNIGERVVVYATAADVEEQRIKAFEEMVAILKEKTGQLVGLGQVQHRAWDLVPLAR